MSNFITLVRNILGWLPIESVKLLALGPFERLDLMEWGFPDLPLISFQSHLIERYVLPVPSVANVLVVGKHSESVKDLLSRRSRIKCFHLESRLIAEPAILNRFPETVSMALGRDGETANILDAFCCMDTDCSSFIVRKTRVLSYIGRIVRRACLFVFNVDPKSLAKHPPWTGKTRMVKGIPLYEELLIRERLHQAGFYDVANVMTLIDGVPQSHSCSISRAEKDDWVFVLKNLQVPDDTAQVVGIYLASKLPLSSEIVT